MKFLKGLFKGFLALIWIVISALLAALGASVVEALGGSDAAIFICGMLIFVLVVPGMTLSLCITDFDGSSYGDRFKNHPRNRRKKPRKAVLADVIKEVFSDAVHYNLITYAFLAGCFLPIVFGYFEAKWLEIIIPALKKLELTLLATSMMNYYLVYFLYTRDVFDKIKKIFLKATKREHLLVKIPDYKEISPKFGEQIRNEKFKKYVGLDGLESKYIKISENDKWICICDKYYPIDLIYGNPEFTDSFYTIKGDRVSLKKEDIPDKAGQELFEFLKRRGSLVDIDSRAVEYLFGEIDYDMIYDMQKVDWAGLRLKWEEAVAQRKHPKVVGKNYKVTIEGGVINPELFDRVLSNSELGKIISAVNKRDIAPADVFDYDRYLNEFTVTNGIKIAEGARVKFTDEALDFLFKCLNDIDEAYFLRAVEVILRCPHSKIQERLEAQALAAYEAQDALRLAGLLYVAKELNYEIESLKKPEDKQTFKQQLPGV